MKANVLKICLLALAAISVAHANVRSVLSSQFLARGEQAVFEIRVEGQDPDYLPRVPKIANVDIDPVGFGRPQMMPGRRIESSYQYYVSSYAVGSHEIPAIEVSVNGKRFNDRADELRGLRSE